MTLDRLLYKLSLTRFRLKLKLRKLKRVLLCDPEIRPGRKALRSAIWNARLGPQIHALVRALEAGGYNAAPTKLTQGCELKIESLEGVMECVTFDTRQIKFDSVKKVNPAETREKRILSGLYLP